MSADRAFWLRIARVIGISALAASILLSGFGPVATSAAAESMAVAAAYTPDELAMLPGETRATGLRIQNPTSAPVVVNPKIRQESGAVSPLVITLDETPVSIPAGGSLTVPAIVTLPARLLSSVTVVTTIGYTGVDSAGSILATLKVLPGTIPALASNALTISQSGDTAMVDTQAADLYFGVQNTSALTQRITGATLTFPTFLKVELTKASRPADAPTGSLTLDLPDTLAPGDGATVHLHVSAPNGVQPGSALVVLSINYEDSVGQNAGFATDSHKISLSVFGEDALTGAFGAAIAPALFVVPGLLFVLVVWFLWWRVYPRELPIEITPPQTITGTVALAILGVLFAMPFPFLYTEIFGRNYSAVYGFVDIVRICVLGIATGAAVWAVAIAVRWVIRRNRFQPNDSARTVLRKITRFKGKAKTKDKLDQVANANYTNQNTDRVFVLRFGPTTALVCPRIVSKPSKEGENAARFDALLTEGKNRELYELVTGPDFSSPEYQPTKDVATVTKVKLTDLTDFGHRRIVSTES